MFLGHLLGELELALQHNVLKEREAVGAVAVAPAVLAVLVQTVVRDLVG
jgi:hypothetical protein